MTMVISGSDGVTFPDSTTQNTTDRYGFVNRIINGDMRIDQRNAGASVSIDGGAPYTLDRYLCQDNTDGSFSVQRSSTAPAGFTNSLLVTITGTDSSLTTTQFGRIVQRIEGFNVADLGWGTASAKTITLSFWVRSSVTGTFSGSLVNNDGNRIYAFTYSISAADTFEQKSITIAGDTSGTWETNSSTGIELNLSIGAGPDRSVTAGSWGTSLAFAATGQTNLFNTNAATWYITGVQLEVGSVATPFERRPYGTELALCQRYFQFMPMTSGASQVTTDTRGYGSHIVEMRVAPTVAATGVLNITDTYSADFTQSSANVSLIANDTRSTFVSMSNFSGLTVGRIYFFPRYTNSNKMSLSAEL